MDRFPESHRIRFVFFVTDVATPPSASSSGHVVGDARDDRIRFLENKVDTPL